MGAGPEASPLDTPVEGASAFGAAWVCGAELALQAGELNLAADDRPENSAQRLENIESAPGNPLAPLQREEGWGEGLGGLAADAHPAPHPNLFPARGEKGPVGARPENSGATS